MLAKNSRSELLAQAKKHAAWFLKGGTTTVEAKSGYGLSVDDEVKILRVVRRLNQETPVEFVPTFLGAHAIPEEFQSAPDRYVSLVIDEMLPRIADERLAEFCDVFCERGASPTPRGQSLIALLDIFLFQRLRIYPT